MTCTWGSQGLFEARTDNPTLWAITKIVETFITILCLKKYASSMKSSTNDRVLCPF